MTIRVPSSVKKLDPEKMAAVFTMALVNPSRDDAHGRKADRPGTSWVRWSETHGPTPRRKLVHPLD